MLVLSTTCNGYKDVTQLMLCRENSLRLKARFIRLELGTLIELHLEIGAILFPMN